MKSNIKKTDHGIFVEVIGTVDYETQVAFKTDLDEILKECRNNDSIPRKIIFDFHHLEFVGSSGITSFVQTLKDFNTKSPIKPGFQNVRNEFKKIIQAFDQEALFDFMEEESYLPESKKRFSH